MAISKSEDALGNYTERGFSIEEPDDHVVILKHDGDEVARFNQAVTTREALRSECALHLIKAHPKPGSRIWKEQP